MIEDYRIRVVIDGQPRMLEVLDTAWQEEYTWLRDQWIQDGEGFLLVYSISSRSSFTRIQKFHHQIQKVKEASVSEPNSLASPLLGLPAVPVPICLVGNKSDRVTEREVSTQEGYALAREFGCEFVESSAKETVNIEKAFYDVVRLLRRQRQKRCSAPLIASQGSVDTVKRSWWGKSISISRSERKSEAGRKRLAYSLVNAAKSNRER
jgi:GTPase KRas protein